MELVSRSSVDGQNLGAELDAMAGVFPVALCDLRVFIGMATCCQHGNHTGHPKTSCLDATYHISCSMVRNISRKPLNGRVLLNMPSAFKTISAFPPPKISV